LAAFIVGVVGVVAAGEEETCCCDNDCGVDAIDIFVGVVVGVDEEEGVAANGDDNGCVGDKGGVEPTLAVVPTPLLWTTGPFPFE